VPVPLTLPSHASILTGNYPPTHGVRDNGAYRLGDEQVTVAEILTAQGYATAAFVGSFVLHRRFGLDQGFELYDDDTASGAAMLENPEAERSAEAVYASFLSWLQSYRSQKPFFVWIHLYDPHAPYVPPEPYRTRYARDPYAGEVAYTDAVVGKIVTALQARGMWERTLFAVVGDHGEGLGEHEEMTHSLLIYNSTLHVPLVIHAPGLLPAGRRVDALVRTIDLAPTLLDFLGFSSSAASFGQGVSLRPLVEGQKADMETLAYSESLYPSLHLGWSALRGLETEKYHFIRAPRRELYDLEADPGETENRARLLPRLARQLEGKLEELTDAITLPGVGSRRAIDPETEAKLRSLGYVSASRSVARGGEEEAPSDPKDKMAIWNQIQLAVFQFHTANYQAALGTLEKVLRSDKDIPLVYEYLGSCHLRLEEPSRAEGVYRQAMERGIESPDLHLQLGLIHQARHELPDAEREFRMALALDELSVSAHYRLASLLRARRQDTGAVEHYRRALEINRRYVYAWNGLGMSLSRLGRHEEALKAFREAVRAHPQGPRPYFNLATQL
ncbi:MAG: sulfatase-like hydrolase/transferase, partial [Acidobacteriota bacterium]